MKAQADDYHICGRDSDDGSVSNQSLSTRSTENMGRTEEKQGFIKQWRQKHLSYWLL